MHDRHRLATLLAPYNVCSTWCMSVCKIRHEGCISSPQQLHGSGCCRSTPHQHLLPPPAGRSMWPSLAACQQLASRPTLLVHCSGRMCRQCTPHKGTRRCWPQNRKIHARNTQTIQGGSNQTSIFPSAGQNRQFVTPIAGRALSGPEKVLQCPYETLERP